MSHRSPRFYQAHNPYRGNKGGRSGARAYTAARGGEVYFPLESWRSKVVLAAVSFAFVLLVLWAIKVQLVDNEFLQSKGETRYSKLLEIPAPRGKIYDRNEVVLASNVPARAIWVIPKEVKMDAPQEQQLARLLGMDATDVHKRVTRSDKQFVYLRRQVPQDIADQIKALKLAGVYSQKEVKRDYPQGEVFAHITGYTNIEGAGQDGIELVNNQTIQGVAGARKVIRDRLGNVIEDEGVMSEARAGEDVHLALDARVQYIVYSALRDSVTYHQATSASAMVIDTQTGEVLALANYPSFDPSARGQMNADNLRNRAVVDVHEPGSTLKPFTVALGLDLGKINPNSYIETGGGKMTIGDYEIGDHVQGSVSIADIIKHSSNIGTAKIALMLPKERMWQMFRDVGFGQTYPIGLPGVENGLLRPAKDWGAVEQATMSYGHGIAVSLMQLAHAYTVFARDGELIELSLFKRPDASPVKGVRIFSAQAAAQLRQMMHGATQPGGTAQKAQVIGYTVAGKTGTAYKAEKGAYNKQAYVATFAGLAPVSKPRIVVAVMVDNPVANGHMGGEVAAPVFSKIVSETLRTLSVAPDAPYKTSVQYNKTVESM